MSAAANTPSRSTQENKLPHRLAWASEEEPTDRYAQDRPLRVTATEAGYSGLLTLPRDGAPLLASADAIEELNYQFCLAAAGGDIPKLRRLLDNEMVVGPNVTDGEGNAALCYAVDGGSRDSVDFLTRKGAKLHTETASGNTAFDIAISAEKFDIATILLANGFDLTQKRRNGQSTLHRALSNRVSREAIYFLLGHKPPLDQTNSDGETPLAVARSLGRHDFVALLAARTTPLRAASEGAGAGAGAAEASAWSQEATLDSLSGSKRTPGLTATVFQGSGASLAQSAEDCYSSDSEA